MGDYLTKEAAQTDSSGCKSGSCGCGGRSVPAEEKPEQAPALPEGVARVRYRIDNMDCPVEEQLIRNRLKGVAGVERLEFNLIERELTVFHLLTDERAVVEALESIGMAPVRLDGAAVEIAEPSALNLRSKLMLLVSGLAAAGAEAVGWVTSSESSWLVIMLALLSIVTAGLPTLRKGWLALKNLTLNISFLMTLAVVGAMLIGRWPEAAMVVFLFALAETIESLSLERVRNAIRSLATIAPETAEVCADGGWQERPVDTVAVGSRIRIRTGARVPLDAEVIAGSAALDQAAITGESMPVDKQAGDRLFAGSIVVDGVVEAVVTATAAESTLARIAAAIQQAQSQRAPTQRFVDSFARYYTPAVVLVAVAVALAGPLLGSGDWYGWFYQALVMLVIACPCALVLSTPVTVVSGLTAAARHGILIKGGTYLESGRKLRAVAFDKTGTLTTGRAVMTDAVALCDMPLEKALLLAASLDDHSSHPVARAIVSGWRSRQPGAQLLAVENFSVLSGHGVRGIVAGETWQVGNHRLVEALGFCSPALEARLAGLENEGKSAVVLCSSAGPVALFGVADTLRPESWQAVELLKGQGVEPVMLSGDNAVTAGTVAAHLGIADARANLLPEQKQEAVGELKQRYGMVGMAGDGINDAPALARADIGFAMGAAGTATALESADVAIMDDDPRKVAAFIGLSRNCAAILRQNIFMALGIKALFMALALSGHATLWMAVFADMGASLLVIFNGLRLLRNFQDG